MFCVFITSLKLDRLAEGEYFSRNCTQICPATEVSAIRHMETSRNIHLIDVYALARIMSSHMIVCLSSLAFSLYVCVCGREGGQCPVKT